MDKTDVEILSSLKRSSTGADLNGITMMINNSPELHELKDRIADLENQQYVENRNNLYRITFSGKNLFWKEDDMENNVLRLLKCSKFTDKQIQNLIGIRGDELEEIIRRLMLTGLIIGEQKTDAGFPYKLLPRGHARVKLISEDRPTNITQNFYNVDKIEINNYINLIQNKIDQIIIQVESDENLEPEKKKNILNTLRNLKEIFSTAEPYAKPFILEALAELLKQGING